LACFCAQQCIEKLLKAVLILHKQKVAKVHDLDDLAAQVQTFIPQWNPDWVALEKLSMLGIAARYPGIAVSLTELEQAFMLRTKVRQELLPVFTVWAPELFQ
jgi:HEPN domain-containing protein